MQSNSMRILRAAFAVVMATSALGITLSAEAANERPQFIALGASTRAPIGWTDFCNENPHDCGRSFAASALSVMAKADVAITKANAALKNLVLLLCID